MTVHGLDGVLLTDSDSVRDGLSAMLAAAIGDHAYELRHVDVQLALFVIEAAKRAEDRADWFPRGKWGTIQEMQTRTERELRWLFQPHQEAVWADKRVITIHGTDQNGEAVTEMVKYCFVPGGEWKGE